MFMMRLVLGLGWSREDPDDLIGNRIQLLHHSVMRRKVSISHHLVLLVLGNLGSWAGIESHDHAAMLSIEFGRERPILPGCHRTGIVPRKASHLKWPTVEFSSCLSDVPNE